MEALNVASVSSSTRERQLHLRGLVGAVRRGGHGGLRPEKVCVVREAQFRYSPAAERVLERLTSKCGTIEKDGGLRLDGR